MAQGEPEINNIRLARNGEKVQLSLDVSIPREKPCQRSIVVYTPRLVGSHDSVDFPEIAILGRHIYYKNARAGENRLVQPDAFMIRHKGGPRTEHYARTISHQPWMENAALKLVKSEGTPCDRRETGIETEAGFTLPPPDTTWTVTRRTRDEEQTGKVSGQARINFRVNRTEILPELGDNSKELEKIRKAIREVGDNKDVRITKYTLRGYASPDGNYANNARLAQGRTESLRQYMIQNWGVPASQIATSAEPEDWNGLRQYVELHCDSLLAAEALLGIIDLDMEPDAKLALMANRHPQDYKALFDKCFPILRRTDYAIEYEWTRTVNRDDGEDRQMVLTPHAPKADDVLEDDVYTLYKPDRPWIALKTNLLFDALLTPNVELEIPFGQDSRWSLMLEDWFPWFLYKKNPKGQIRTDYRIIDKIYRNAYEVWTLGAEMRYWFRPRCSEARPTLNGTFVGVYGAAGKYDWEWESTGDQGEFFSAGLTIGKAWPLTRHWNLELSASAGVVWGPRRHYNGEYDDTHLLWKYNSNIFYAGPTKLKLSIAWLIPSLRKQQKGGRL